jgi:4-hydroxybenzoate polyprenyltransferase
MTQWTQHDTINLFHIVIVAPLLLWLGVSKGKGIPDFIWGLLVFFAVVVFFSHGYMLLTRLFDRANAPKGMDYP